MHAISDWCHICAGVGMVGSGDLSLVTEETTSYVSQNVSQNVSCQNSPVTRSMSDLDPSAISAILENSKLNNREEQYSDNSPRYDVSPRFGEKRPDQWFGIDICIARHSMLICLFSSRIVAIAKVVNVWVKIG